MLSRTGEVAAKGDSAEVGSCVETRAGGWCFAGPILRAGASGRAGKAPRDARYRDKQAAHRPLERGCERAARGLAPRCAP